MIKRIVLTSMLVILLSVVSVCFAIVINNQRPAPGGLMEQPTQQELWAKIQEEAYRLNGSIVEGGHIVMAVIPGMRDLVPVIIGDKIYYDKCSDDGKTGTRQNAKDEGGDWYIDPTKLFKCHAVIKDGEVIKLEFFEVPGPVR